MNDISVCMIVKNEESRISSAIQSIIPYVSEVIVVDHYSDDNTKQIASQMGAKVFEHEWTNHFAEARNYCISKASHSFILMMDADEEYLGDNYDLEHACLLMKDSMAASRITIENETENGGKSYVCLTRLFPNISEYRYKGRIHEQLLCCGNTPAIIETSIRFKHYGYIKDEITSKDKISRNLYLLYRELEDNPNDPYVHFQIGRTLKLNRDNLQAKSHMERSLENVTEPFPYFHSSLMLEYLNILVEMGEWKDFFRMMSEALEKYPDYTDLYYRYGTAIIEAKRPDWFHKIPNIFNACLQLGEASNHKYETVCGVGSYRAHYNLGLFYELTGDRALAEFHYHKSLEQGFKQAGKRLQQFTNVK